MKVKGSKTYAGVWLLLVLTLSIMALMVVYETKHDDAWGVIKYLAMACVGTIGYTQYGLRSAIKKQEDKIDHVCKMVDRRDVSTKGTNEGRRESD